MERSVFASYHPIINFVYFCAVIIFGVFLLHPVLLCISVVASLSYALFLVDKKMIKFFLCFLLPMLIGVTLVNPLVNQQGITILAYVGNNPITLESLIYGVITGCMLISIISWFSCYNVVMTSDKFIYLFGRVIPSMSLILSMALRFVPTFKHQIQIIARGQKCIGRDVSSGTKKQKARHGMKIISIMVTWALENAIETADSMRSRGYGLAGRTTFSIYRFDARDTAVGLVLLVLIIVVAAGSFVGICKAEYFPAIEIQTTGAAAMIVYVSYLLLCFLPMILQIKEGISWRFSQSKI